MYIVPNTIIYRHHVNWSTYNTKTATTKKKGFSSSKSHLTLCNISCVRGGILSNNSNICQKNDLHLMIFSLGTPFENQVILYINKFNRYNSKLLIIIIHFQQFLEQQLLHSQTLWVRYQGISENILKLLHN